MTGLTWFELSKVADGTRVVFVEPWDAGTQGVITHNYLNEMQQSVSVLPDSADLREKLKTWDGEIILGTHLNSGADTQSEPHDDDAAEWFQPSPLATLEEVS